jgi:hypothetical protein
MTHGLPVGPGGGPEALQMTADPRLTDPIAIKIRALYAANPTPELAAVLQDLGQGQ